MLFALHEDKYLIVNIAHFSIGLETLGIFRPWRLAESPYIISKALALFLRAVCPNDTVPLEDRDLLGFGRDDDALNAFAEALADAGTHNTIACLKWVRSLTGNHTGGPSNNFLYAGVAPLAV